MQVKLVRLSINNFKGVENFTLRTDGNSANIYGTNGTGKTTILDAYTWLLFDKDSRWQSNFEIKRVDSRGRRLPILEIAVEAEFSIDGNPLVLKKVLTEKWVRKRGSVETEFAGNTTKYFVTGVPVKKKDFVKKVEEIASEELFKLLVTPTYFNEQLHWQDRRKILMEVCGELTDDEVIANDNSLFPLSEILNRYSIDEYKKLLMSQRSELRKSLDGIPVRIDELQKAMPDEVDVDAIKQKIGEINEAISQRKAEIEHIQNGSQKSILEKRLSEIEAEIMSLENEAEKARYKVLQAMSSLEFEIEKRMRRVDDLNAEIEEKEFLMNKLREEWYAVNSKEFDGDTTCPTCGQELPADQIEEAKRKFNIDKSENLEAITQKGKLLKENVESLKQEIAKLEEERSAFEERYQDKKKQLEAMEKEEVAPELEAERKKLIEQLETDDGEDERIEELHEQIKRLEEERQQYTKQLMQVEQAKIYQKRIDDLKEEERTIASELEHIEMELDMIEQFGRKKAKMLEDLINSRFKLARFKLFNQQVNGGIQETCEVTFAGVPYNSLNHAARINVGLDIINVLSEHYGLRLPVFIDNRESIVELLEIENQVISLIVSGQDDELRIEIEEGEKVYG